MHFVFLSTSTFKKTMYNREMHIGELLKDRLGKRRRGTRWTDMVKECKDIINKERLGTKYKQLSFIVVRNKVSHLNDDELANFISLCKDGKNRRGSFSKVFFGALKIKKDESIGEVRKDS